MGGITPNWKIPFPHQHEKVTPTHFKNFSAATENALIKISELADTARKRPYVYITGTGVSVNVNTETYLTFNTYYEREDPYGMWTNNRALTAKVPGVYLFNVSFDGGEVTTLNSVQSSLRVNDSVVYINYRRVNTENMNYVPNVNISWLYPLKLNDVIDARIRISGTGTLIPIWSATWSARRICTLESGTFTP